MTKYTAKIPETIAKLLMILNVPGKSQGKQKTSVTDINRNIVKSSVLMKTGILHGDGVAIYFYVLPQMLLALLSATFAKRSSADG